MRKYRWGALLLSVLLLSACGKKNPIEPTPGLQPTPVSTLAIEPVQSETAQPVSTKAAPSVEILQTLAYYFEDVGGVPMIYGAAEIKNTGGVPVVIEQATFGFTIGGSAVEKTMTPMLTEEDVLNVGQTSQICLWATYDKDVKETDNITVEVNVTFKGSEEEPSPISLSNLRVIQNYPGFATVSGLLKNNAATRGYSFAITYLAFYDQENKLLGVWHFTKNAALPAEESRNFVMHMKSLPIPGLAENTARIVGRAIGVE